MASEQPDPSTDPIAFVSGEYVGTSRARISVMDRGLLYGDGAFESIRLSDGRIFRLDEHLKRLQRSLEYLSITVPQGIPAILSVLAQRNGLTNGYFRVVVTRGVCLPGIDPRKVVSGPTLIVTVIQRPPLCLTVESVTAQIVSVRQSSLRGIDPRQKTINYANKVIAKEQAIQAGADIPIILNDDGIVTEGGTENIFIVKDRVVRTSPIDSGLLPGVTRDSVLEICGRSGITSREEPITTEALLAADEVFVTGTSSGIVPVSRVDSTIFPRLEESIAGRLRLRYLEIIAGLDSGYMDWLTPVASRADPR